MLFLPGQTQEREWVEFICLGLCDPKLEIVVPDSHSRLHLSLMERKRHLYRVINLILRQEFKAWLINHSLQMLFFAVSTKSSEWPVWHRTMEELWPPGVRLDNIPQGFPNDIRDLHLDRWTVPSARQGESLLTPGKLRVKCLLHIRTWSCLSIISVVPGWYFMFFPASNQWDYICSTASFSTRKPRHQ